MYYVCVCVCPKDKLLREIPTSSTLPYRPQQSTRGDQNSSPPIGAAALALSPTSSLCVLFGQTVLNVFFHCQSLAPVWPTGTYITKRNASVRSTHLAPWRHPWPEVRKRNYQKLIDTWFANVIIFSAISKLRYIPVRKSKRELDCGYCRPYQQFCPIGFSLSSHMFLL